MTEHLKPSIEEANSVHSDDNLPVAQTDLCEPEPYAEIVVLTELSETSISSEGEFIQLDISDPMPENIAHNLEDSEIVNLSQAELNRRSNFLKISEDARQTRLELIQSRHSRLFGEDVKTGLIDMHHNQALSLRDISDDTGYSESGIKKLMYENGVELIHQTLKQSKRKFQIVQEALWSNPNSWQHLTAREKQVISKRFLFEGLIPTLEEVGEELELSREYIRQIENAAIKKLTEE